MASDRRLFREFDDSRDAESLRLARRVVRGLALQMRHIVVAPGSRSAPLAYALEEAEQLGAITVHMRIDERSAAFTALGLAMASGQPAGVITTSGTAAGNLTPAVMEADMAGIPLVAITADRPESLHGTGANQTVWQQGMFAGRARDELHLEQNAVAAGQLRLEPTSRDDILAAETQVMLLLRAALGSTRQASGPVHLNIGFADPLVPSQLGERDAAGAPPGGGRWARQPVITTPAEQLRAQQLLRASPPESEDPLGTAEQGAGEADHQAATRTVIVIGHNPPPGTAAWAEQWTAAGHPVLAEPTSGARWSELGAIPGYRLLLQAPAGSEAADLVSQTERVVVLGRPTLTRPVQRLISRRDTDVWQFEPGPEPWHDQRLPRQIISDYAELQQMMGRGAEGWRSAWEEKGLAAQRAIDAALRADAEEYGDPSSVQVAQYVAETVRTPLLLGSSSAIRDVDLTAVMTRSQDTSRRVYAPRGLAGIDGNLSMASGISLAAQRRVTAVVGDLTLLHDVNALLLPSTERPVSLDVVVINDAGGAIFDQLEHGDVARRSASSGLAERAEAVERLFGTPQTVDIEALADAYQHQYRFVENLEDLGSQLEHPDDRLGIRIIEIRTDRSRLRHLHQQIRDAAAEL